MKTLITGFNRFGSVEVNPSQLVIEHLAARADANLTAEVLPTEFEAAGHRLRALIHEARPEVIICLGLAQGTDAIRLERIALNLDDAELPDNAGLAPRGQPIVEGAPLAYRSTLPLEDIHLALLRRVIPAVISNHAGTYVCNHAFFVARHEVETLRLPARCGFIHLPALLDLATVETPEPRGLPLETMLAAVDAVLETCAA